MLLSPNYYAKMITMKEEKRKNQAQKENCAELTLPVN